MTSFVCMYFAYMQPKRFCSSVNLEYDIPHWMDFQLTMDLISKTMIMCIKFIQMVSSSNVKHHMIKVLPSYTSLRSIDTKIKSDFTYIILKRSIQRLLAGTPLYLECVKSNLKSLKT